MMMHVGKVLIGLAGGMVLGAGAAAAATADAAANPYQGIVARNLFSLKDPPPPPEPPAEVKPQPKCVLNGVTRMANRKWAFFKITPQTTKPGEAAKEESYSLTEGERRGDVEVVQIDEVAGLVKLSYAGTPLTLDFTNNAAKAVAAAPAPGGPGGPPGVMPVPGVSIPGNPNPGIRQPGFSSPTRPLRAGVGGPGMNPAGAGGFGMTGMPAMPGLATSGVAAGQTQPGSAAFTREQSDLLMEAWRDQRRNDSTIPPIPPTSLTAAIEQANNEGATTTPQPQQGTTVRSLPPIPGRPSMPPMPRGNF